ncbi:MULTISPECIES: LysR family transcriptional regulator [Luteibacter]|uniref:LysR family transcriptional regulator n=1 Tax=Luteibacter TaxID=242605 RepID=UPI00055D5D1F|nr:MULTISPECIES: LysR family transcriptional regulator [unclassified Luteibacter]
MANTEPAWDLFRSFLAVLREGSLSGAARSLDMTQPSLGRHVRELEASLGVPLFSRASHGLIPTDAALELQPHAQAMASAAASVLRVASGTREALHGVVRITASEVVGVEILPPMLATFRRAHPGIVIELSTTNRTENLLRRDADIAVRSAMPEQDAMVARHVCDIPLGLYGHPDYLAVAGAPERVADIVTHALIGYDEEKPYIRALRPAGVPYSREHFALRTDNDLAAMAAIRAGFGIGFCQVPLAHRMGLVRLLPDELEVCLPIWVVMHEDQRKSRRVRAVFDHLAASLAAFGGGPADAKLLTSGA